MRRPLVLTNWKASMTTAEGLAYVQALLPLVQELCAEGDVLVFPPFTSLAAIAAALQGTGIQMGAQDLASSDEPYQTGQMTSRLLIEAGCRWVLVGHWEVRRALGDDEAKMKHKLQVALAAGLQVVTVIGQAASDPSPLEDALRRQLEQVLAGCSAANLAHMAIMYEPQGLLGRATPASTEHVASAVHTMRDWLGDRYGAATAEGMRIVYGGSLGLAHAPELLADAGLDGLGATRAARDPAAFAAMLRMAIKAHHHPIS